MASDQHERWEATQFGASWAIHPAGADSERWDIARISPEAYHPDGWDAAKAEAERRARLMASAPEMADRIEALEAEVERLREALELIAHRGAVFDAKGTHSKWVCDIARAALEEA